jgi:hypothetical protein
MTLPGDNSSGTGNGLHRSAEEDQGSKGHQKKKQHVLSGEEEPSSNAYVPATPGMTLPVMDSQGQPSDPNAVMFDHLKTHAGQRGWVHNRSLGYRGTQEMIALQQSAGAEMEVDDHGNETQGTKESEESENEESPETAVEWTVVAHHKETILALRVAFEDLRGVSFGEKYEDLMDILMGNKVNPPRKPTKMRLDGKLYFRVTVSTQEDMEALMEGVTYSQIDKRDEDEDDESQEGSDNESETMEDATELSVNPTPRPLFERIDPNQERQHDQGRSIELYGMPARVNMDLVKLATNKLGQVENVNIRGCSRGLKVTATVWFTDATPVEQMKQQQLQHITVGNDLVRLRRVGDQTIQWELQYTGKLHGLPRDTTPLNLFSMLKSVKVDFVEIPRYYVNNHTQVRYRQEAFVYFKSEEDMMAAMVRSFKIDKHELMWMGTKDKRCYTCHETSHGSAKCPTAGARREERAHQKQVMAFHASSPSLLKTGTSFADLLRGKGNMNKGQRDMRGKREQCTKKGTQSEVGQQGTQQTVVAPKTTEQFPPLAPSAGTTNKQQKQISPNAKQQESFSATIAKLMERQQTIESSVNEMQKTIVHLMTKQNEMMASIQSLNSNLVVMVERLLQSSATSHNVSQTFLSQSSLSPSQTFLSQTSLSPSQSQRSDTPLEDNRKMKRTKQRGDTYDAAPISFIPTSNESRAGIEAAISAHKQVHGALHGQAKGGPAANTRNATTKST